MIESLQPLAQLTITSTTTTANPKALTALSPVVADAAEDAARVKSDGVADLRRFRQGYEAT